MRTDIFNKFSDLPEAFREDFTVLWDLPEDQRLALIPIISELSRVDISKEAENIVDRAISAIGGNASELLRALKSLRFISAEWNPTQDKPENFLKDLNELALIPSEKAEEGKRFLFDFFSEIQKDNLRRLQKQYANSLLPSLQGITTLIDFRAVINNPYKWGEKIEDYEPRCIDFVPIILVRIRRTSGDPKSFEFQCEPNDVHLIISSLKATLKELESGKLSLPGNIR